MPIRVTWDDPEQSILRADFSPSWTLADFRVAIEQIHQESNEATSTTYRGVIVDLSRETMPPVGAMPHFKYSLKNLGGIPRPVVFVDADLVTRRLMELVKRVYGIERPII